ncbi:hypothetical protein JKP88DRAFT_326719 [Tribonema minus]|uniref:Uncharacterized protein n=1 Tax=Tribonema minus TaxID=303371 RepID=A0A835YZQ0_9STRA|nr:hypothetical protein JKP88DRAFT_326719 [Tribonema minus]
MLGRPWLRNHLLQVLQDGDAGNSTSAPKRTRGVTNGRRMMQCVWVKQEPRLLYLSDSQHAVAAKLTPAAVRKLAAAHNTSLSALAHSIVRLERWHWSTVAACGEPLSDRPARAGYALTLPLCLHVGDVTPIGARGTSTSGDPRDINTDERVTAALARVGAGGGGGGGGARRGGESHRALVAQLERAQAMECLLDAAGVPCRAPAYVGHGDPAARSHSCPAAQLPLQRVTPTWAHCPPYVIQQLQPPESAAATAAAAAPAAAAAAAMPPRRSHRLTPSLQAQSQELSSPSQLTPEYDGGGADEGGEEGEEGLGAGGNVFTGEEEPEFRPLATPPLSQARDEGDGEEASAAAAAAHDGEPTPVQLRREEPSDSESGYETATQGMDSQPLTQAPDLISSQRARTRSRGRRRAPLTAAEDEDLTPPLGQPSPPSQSPLPVAAAAAAAAGAAGAGAAVEAAAVLVGASDATVRVTATAAAEVRAPLPPPQVLRLPWHTAPAAAVEAAATPPQPAAAAAAKQRGTPLPSGILVLPPRSGGSRAQTPAAAAARAGASPPALAPPQGRPAAERPAAAAAAAPAARPPRRLPKPLAAAPPPRRPAAPQPSAAVAAPMQPAAATPQQMQAAQVPRAGAQAAALSKAPPHTGAAPAAPGPAGKVAHLQPAAAVAPPTVQSRHFRAEDYFDGGGGGGGSDFSSGSNNSNEREDEAAAAARIALEEFERRRRIKDRRRRYRAAEQGQGEDAERALWVDVSAHVAKAFRSDDAPGPRRRKLGALTSFGGTY